MSEMESLVFRLYIFTLLILLRVTYIYITCYVKIGKFLFFFLSFHLDRNRESRDWNSLVRSKYKYLKSERRKREGEREREKKGGEIEKRKTTESVAVKTRKKRKGRKESTMEGSRKRGEVRIPRILVNSLKTAFDQNLEYGSITWRRGEETEVKILISNFPSSPSSLHSSRLLRYRVYFRRYRGSFFARNTAKG